VFAIAGLWFSAYFLIFVFLGHRTSPANFAALVFYQTNNIILSITRHEKAVNEKRLGCQRIGKMIPSVTITLDLPFGVAILRRQVDFSLATKGDHVF
jgi:hypothetical protein